MAIFRIVEVFHILQLNAQCGLVVHLRALSSISFGVFWLHLGAASPKLLLVGRLLLFVVSVHELRCGRRITPPAYGARPYFMMIHNEPEQSFAFFSLGLGTKCLALS